MPKAGNRTRRTDKPQSRLADRDVASTSGVPVRDTSSGDSARGGQNGAAPQGRASSKRPAGEQTRPKGKPLAAQPSKANSKAAVDTEQDPPVKGRLQRIKERLEKEERERLEKSSSNLSSEAPRAVAATGGLVQEQGAVGGKGPSRLGPGRTNSSSLPAEQAVSRDAGKPSRKRALQVTSLACYFTLSRH